MTLDHQPIEDTGEDARGRPSGPGRLVLAGVVGACVLGGGLGLWARPVDPARAMAKPEPVALARPARLQIVVSEAPAPLGQPLEVLPEAHAVAYAAPFNREEMAPGRPASGLVKVDAPIAAAPQVLRAADAKSPPGPQSAPAAPRDSSMKAELDAAKAEDLKAEKRKAERAKAARRVEARAAEARAAETKARRDDEREAARQAKAEMAKTEKARATRLAKAEKTKAEKARTAKVRTDKAKAERTEATRLAKAEARRREAASKPATRKHAGAAAKPAKAKVDVARAKAKRKPPAMADARAAKPKVQKAKAPARSERARATAPAPRRVVVPRGEGPLRVAKVNPCAGYDPGEAAVCADPRLGVRDRQLQQAYRNAEAAGVPASALRRQQARWQQARAAAAREAPWAVEDVYVARISELNDLTRDAREN